MTTDLIPSGHAHDMEPAGDPLERFDLLLPRFLARCKSERTRATYRRGLDLYRQLCADRNLDPLRLDAVLAWSTAQNALRGTLSDDTVIIRLSAVQSFLSWAYAMSLTPLKPELVADSIAKPPARQLSPRDILTADEAQRLLGAAEPGRDHALIRVMLDGGLRISEALGLRVRDLYSAADRFYLHVAHGKGDRSRDVEISPDLFAELRDYVAGREGARLLFRLDRVTAWRMVAATAQRAGLDKHVTPHGLRHTHAHHLRLAGMPLEVLAERLGHGSVEVTRRYTRPAEMAQAVPLPALPWARSSAVQGAI